MLYAVDRRYWRVSKTDIDQVFKGELMTHSDFIGVKKVRSACVANSGANAIALAASMGAKRIILLGYDCQKTGGKTHWHGDHPAPLGNAGSIDTWPQKFQRIAHALKKVEVINCSRVTALKTFKKGVLEDYL